MASSADPIQLIQPDPSSIVLFDPRAQFQTRQHNRPININDFIFKPYLSCSEPDSSDSRSVATVKDISIYLQSSEDTEVDVILSKYVSNPDHLFQV